ncbi:MAG: hypothetical protein WC746_05675 [archaeon]|jgi:hypothetical protein
MIKKSNAHKSSLQVMQGIHVGDSWESVQAEIKQEQASKVEERELRRKARVVKAHRKGVLATRRKILFARGLVAKRREFLKEAHSKRLRKSAFNVIEILPPEAIEKIRNKLLVSDKNPRALIDALVGRVIFLPEREFVLLTQELGANAKRPTPAWEFANYAFLNTKYCDMRWVRENAVHELTHLVSSLSGKSYNPSYQETLSVALDLFSGLEETPRIREKVFARANKVYAGKYDTPEYSYGVNQGKKAFKTAYELMQNHGREAALFFFRDLFLSDVASDHAISNASKAAQQAYPAEYKHA